MWANSGVIEFHKLLLNRESCDASTSYYVYHYALITARQYRQPSDSVASLKIPCQTSFFVLNNINYGISPTDINVDRNYEKYGVFTPLKFSHMSKFYSFVFRTLKIQTS